MDGRAGAGVILTSPKGFKIRSAVRFGFWATNNKAEYEALLAGLRLAKSLAVRRLIVQGDSQLVIRQVQGDYKARQPEMLKCLNEVKSAIKAFRSVELQYVCWDENTKADELSRLSLEDISRMDSAVYVELLEHASSSAKEEVAPVETISSLYDDIYRYLRTGALPDDRKDARRIQARSRQYTIHNNVLYRRSYTLPLLQCLRLDEAEQVMLEVYEGICD
ncbi:hypothetical protein NE237_023856 [Protea cynaroides]|uniref:RNase H type-1 domain-containing protein n=1 Tax=Protea cynaroides TaxID=273540 RepID=A0A9Q0K5T1_9MAGN|nr:hypothetical protein NE237_023856 [Protea cynaroides]